MRLTKIIEDHLEGGNRHALGVLVRGREDQCVDTFIEGVETVILPKLLLANNLLGSARSITLVWPVENGKKLDGGEDEIDYYVSLLISNVKSELGLSINAPNQTVLKALKQRRASALFKLGMALEDWRDHQVTILGRWFQWWQSLDFTGLPYPILIAISVTYSIPSTRSGLAKLFWTRSLSRVRHLMEGLARDPSMVGNFHILPELADIGFNDLGPWISDHAPQDRDREALRAFLRRRFEPRNRLPMETTASLLKAAIDSRETYA